MNKKIMLAIMIVFIPFIMSNTSVTAEDSTFDGSNPIEQWVSKTDLPTEVSMPMLAQANGGLYLIGGAKKYNFLSETYLYNIEKDTWERKADMPTPRSSASVAAISDKIYIIGGVTSNLHRLDNVEIYDTKTNKWTSGAPMPAKKNVTFTAVVDNKIYVGGGSNEGNLSKEFYCYDPKEDKWIRKSDMPTTIRGGTASVLGGEIYVMGGSPGSSNNVLDQNIYKYDSSSDKWTTQKTKLKYGVLNATSTVYKDEIFILGGKMFGENNTNKVQVYNPSHDSIRDFKSFRYPRAGAVATTIQNKLYLIGGSSKGDDAGGSNPLKSVEMYSFANNSEESKDETVQPISDGDRAMLVITMVTGLQKEYDLSRDEVNDFINWYDKKDSGTGSSRYEIDKHNNNIGPFKNRKDNVIFKNILAFEVNEYSTDKSSN